MNPPVQHRWLPYWLAKAGHRVPPGDGTALKLCLDRLGLRSRVFKLYVECGDALFRPLGSAWIAPDRPDWSLRNVLEFLQLMQACEVDMPPPPILVKALARCQFPGESIGAMPAWVFRGAWRALAQATYRGASEEAFLNDEFLPAVCWFFDRGYHQESDSNRGKAGWSWVRDRWASEKRRRSLPAFEREWHALVGGTTVAGFRFLPLTSAAALEDEGTVMSHCIANYVEVCRTGHLHVFTLRELPSMERAATLALGGDGKDWRIVGLKAECNREPEAAVKEAAERFIRGLTSSVRPQPIPEEMFDRVLERIAAIHL